MENFWVPELPVLISLNRWTFPFWKANFASEAPGVHFVPLVMKLQLVVPFPLMRLLLTVGKTKGTPSPCLSTS